MPPRNPKPPKGGTTTPETTTPTETTTPETTTPTETTTPETTTPRVRKNQARLTAEEKAAFIAAIKALKADGTYDHHVQEHRDGILAFNPDVAHGGPAFYPWHRECLRRFELQLQAVDPSVTLPYWDPVVDNSPTSSLWAPDFMGGNGEGSTYEVRSGPFAYSTGGWTLNVRDNSTQPPYLRRAFGIAIATLPSGSLINNTLGRVPYDSSPWNMLSSDTTSFRRWTEAGVHNRVHNWIGGTMQGASSPNDPIFWLVHCFLDRHWARWQKRNPTQSYLPESGGPAGHNLNDPMWPWSSEPNPPTPASVLDHKALGYVYDDEASWT
jgi:tyrosinase